LLSIRTLSRGLLAQALHGSKALVGGAGKPVCTIVRGGFQVGAQGDTRYFILHVPLYRDRRAIESSATKRYGIV
jgi:hypothetical protein